jgi:hypothetical protein
LVGLGSISLRSGETSNVNQLATVRQPKDGLADKAALAGWT